jgi:hypothetical protein
VRYDFLKIEGPKAEAVCKRVLVLAREAGIYDGDGSLLTRSALEEQVEDVISDTLRYLLRGKGFQDPRFDQMEKMLNAAGVTLDGDDEVKPIISFPPDPPTEELPFNPDGDEGISPVVDFGETTIQEAPVPQTVEQRSFTEEPWQEEKTARRRSSLLRQRHGRIDHR